MTVHVHYGYTRDGNIPDHTNLLVAITEENKKLIEIS